MPTVAPSLAAPLLAPSQSVLDDPSPSVLSSTTQSSTTPRRTPRRSPRRTTRLSIKEDWTSILSSLLPDWLLTDVVIAWAALWCDYVLLTMPVAIFPLLQAGEVATGWLFASKGLVQVLVLLTVYVLIVIVERGERQQVVLLEDRYAPFSGLLPPV